MDHNPISNSAYSEPVDKQGINLAPSSSFPAFPESGDLIGWPHCRMAAGSGDRVSLAAVQPSLKERSAVLALQGGRDNRLHGLNPAQGKPGAGFNLTAKIPPESWRAALQGPYRWNSRTESPLFSRSRLTASNTLASATD
jgi:hypothetical protein